MEIYLLRHAEAQLRGEGLADKDRKLTGKGKRDARAVVALAHSAEAAPELIFSSPLKRALETAAIAQLHWNKARLVETRSLVPDASPDLIWREIVAQKNVAEIMLVGHEPHLSRLVSFLLEAALAVDFKKSAIVRISTGKTGPPRGVLKWMITPKLARAGK